MDSVIEEAEALAKTGVRELIVVAQDITRYGSDLYGKPSLSPLLKRLCLIDGIEWIRLHYLYPDAIDGELIETIASEAKILKYLDIPIQHINNVILRRMNRRGTGGEIRALFARLREAIPGLVLRTSLIVGLPGEGEAEFDELAGFLRETRIERAGVFVYSPEEGTPAALMPGRCTGDEARHRQEILLQIQSEIMDTWSRGFVGTVQRVLCQGYDVETGMLFGRSFADSPDIDTTVFFSGETAVGEFAPVLIEDVSDGDWYGREVSL
jgi:ribosomal protein S12 methylthiotransferase